MTLPPTAGAFLGGTSDHSLIEGFQAVLDGGAHQDAFTENMSGVVDTADVDENAPSAFAQINEDTRTEFAANKNARQLQHMPLISLPPRRNWKRCCSRYVPRFDELSPRGLAKMAEVQTHVKNYTTNESVYTAYRFKALKCGIDDFYPSDIDPGDASLIVAQARDVVKKPSLTRCLNTKP